MEHFEQDLDGVRSFFLTGEPHANWSSEAVTIDTRRARFTFTYVVDIGSRSVSVEGVTSAQFQRESPHDPPNAYAGYAHDLNDPTRIHIQEHKISDELIPWDKAHEKARNTFGIKP